MSGVPGGSSPLAVLTAKEEIAMNIKLDLQNNIYFTDHKN